ncbi:MAG: ATP-binding protein [Lachnospiraceae bacterium]|jgi:DNA replication protein DnaC
MGITQQAYEEIIKEYEEQRLLNDYNLDKRRAAIMQAIPSLEGIENEITSLYVKRALCRLNNPSEATDEELAGHIAKLNAQKSRLLNEAGFSVEDLNLHYLCVLCEDTGYVDNKPCSCFRAKIIEKLYDNSHIRSILERENFNTYSFKYYSDEEAVTNDGKTPLDVAKDAVGKALTFIKEFPASSSNLYICGDTGVGKTFLVNCIARELINAGYSVIYLSSIRLFEILADNVFGRQEANELPAKLIYDCDLLIIDDLGTEMVNSFTQTQLFDCINERYLRERNTIISSNLSVKQLQAVYSERVFSRITSNYSIIKLFGDDIRIKKALEV